MLAAAAGLLLVIACVNLAHLWFDRTIGRRREFAIRGALGAPTWRIVQQLLSESFLLAMGGCALGLLLAYTGTRLLAAMGPVDFQSMQVWRMDGVVVAFSATLALGAGLLFGAVPALRTARTAARHAWGRGPVADTRFPRLRRGLMIGQIALCTTVLAAAGLLLHSFARVSTMERGFVTGDVLAVSLALPADRYDTPRTLMFYAEALDRIRALPGVVAAGAATVPPLTSEESVNPVYAEDDVQESLQRPLALHRAVTTGYFSALGIPLVAGRLLEEREAAPAVVISVRLAAEMWPGTPPASVVGRRVRIGEVTSPLRTVVGVVGDVREGALDRASLPAIYRPHQDAPVRDMTLLVRSPRDPTGLTAAVRDEVRRLDHDLPLGAVRTMGDIVSMSLSGRRFQLVLVSLFALVGLMLAAVGVYGVTSVSVTSRTQEIGVRLALGGSPGTVFRSALADGLLPVGIGLLVGLVFACLAGFAMERLLFGVAPIDAVTLTSVAVVFLGVGGVACYVPARRAAHLDPMSALRCD
jgi:predicted permease